MAINFPNSPSVNDIHVSGANRWQWNGSSWTRIGGAITDAINSTNDNSTTTLYPVMVSGTGSQNAKIATTANKNLKFNAAEGDLTVGGDISGINANLTGILTASQYNSITAPGANITGVATALQLKGPLTSSGINVTGVSTFSGNVTVGGILTYEDVKNVDSIGLGTFRNGVVVKTGTATTALIVEGDARITGILTVGTGSLVITDKDINATGIITGANFKSGTTNVHNVGVEAAGINVLGADTPIGTGATVYNSGLFVGKQGAEFQGVVTASSFKGSGADLTDVISGIGIGTESGIVGYAATIVHFKGPGVSTAYYSATTGVGTVYFQGGGGASVSIAENAPSSPGAGDLWWDSDVGNLQIYYTDANSSQWVTANNSGPQGPQGAQGATGAQGHQGVQGAQGHQGVQGAVGAQGAQGRQGAQGVQGSVGIASLTISTGAPSSPAQGDMWWDSDDANLSIYYNDGNSSQWVNINSGPAGAQGAQGVAGAQGAQGHQGVQGATGSTGNTGAQGHQGVQGAAGNATINNNANNKVITGSGSANTLEAEGNLTYDGTTLKVNHTTNPILNLTSTNGGPYNTYLRMMGNDTELRGSNGNIEFFTGAADGTSSTERLRITSGGDAVFKGSGTDVTITPTDGLINFGMDGRSSFVTGTNACYIYSGSGASGTIPAGTLVLQARSNVDRDIVMVTGSSSPTERFRIGSNGNCSFGGQSTDGHSGHTNLFIGAMGNLYAETSASSTNSTSWSNNAYIPASGGWKYRSSGRVSNIYQYDGGIGFRYAGSGSAGGTVTWNQSAILRNDGSLLFKTTATNYDTTAGIILSNYTDGSRDVTPGTLICSTTDIALIANLSDSNDGIVAVWRKGGSSKGNVQISGNSTSYNTSSDYRLKENNVAISDGISRLKTLRPYRFNWKSDPGKTIDGFFAHEVTLAVPEAVNGEKDADPGDSGMGYQSMDHSKLVPLLTAALQEAITKIETLEIEVAALKSS